MISSRPEPPVPLSRRVTWIEFGLIGIVTSSAVPRMPSGPGVDDLIEAAVKWVRSMFLLVDDRELDAAVGQDGDDLVGRRAGELSGRRRVVDDERELGVGIVRVGLVAALVDDPHPGHVVAAVVAGQRREEAVGPDVVDR